MVRGGVGGGVASSPSRYRRQEAHCLNNSVHFSLKEHKNNVFPRRECFLEPLKFLHLLELPI